MEIAGTDDRCEGCPNHPLRTVAAHGASPARVLMLAGAPRHHDELSGRAFMSPLYTWLQETLASAGIEPAAVHYATLVACRPPHQRPLREEEVSACGTRLAAILAAVRPEVIVLCGADALAAVVPGATLGPVHGRLLRIGDVVYIPIRHPYATLHHEPYVAELREDLRGIAAVLAHGGQATEYSRQALPPPATPSIVRPSVVAQADAADAGVGTSASGPGTGELAPGPSAAIVEPPAPEVDDGRALDEPAEELVTPSQLSLF